ncbi:MAG: hypothetical protein Q9168_000769 [Polycauliona sp. 1 TL-2023]
MTTDPPSIQPGEKKRREASRTTKGFCQHIPNSKHGTGHCLYQSKTDPDDLQSKPGQGGDADVKPRDLRAQLLEAEAAHFSKTDGTAAKPATIAESTTSSKRQLEAGPGLEADGEEDIDAKRRRVLEETRHLDADSDDSSGASSEEDSDDEEDETAELLRELEKIKKERAEKQAHEVIHPANRSMWKPPDMGNRTAKKQKRIKKIVNGTLLLGTHFSTHQNPPRRNEGLFSHFTYHAPAHELHRWDDDVVFRNQARGTENKGKREFVNVGNQQPHSD